MSFHPDSIVIERVGRAVVMDHFSMSRQGIWLWRKNGVPKAWRKALALLGESHGHDMDEFKAATEDA